MNDNFSDYFGGRDWTELESLWIESDAFLFELGVRSEGLITNVGVVS